MRKASVVAGSIAAATAGSAIFGGVALACNHHNSHHNGHHSNNAADHNTEGGNGTGGNATNNCINLGLGLLSGIGLGGQGSSDAGGCTANANGTGGSATDY